MRICCILLRLTKTTGLYNEGALFLYGVEVFVLLGFIMLYYNLAESYLGVMIASTSSVVLFVCLCQIDRLCAGV